MNNISYFIYFFSFTIIVFGGLIIYVSNLLHVIFSFLGILISTAALFILAEAEFVGVTQLLVYVGGILILILFGTMLTKNYSKASKNQFNFSTFLAIISVSFLGWFIYILFSPYFNQGFKILNLFKQPANSIQQIGFMLLTNYVFCFELSGILLLASLIGALYVSKK